MKKAAGKLILLFFCTGVCGFKAYAQLNPNRLVAFISEATHIDKPAVYDLYSRLNYKTLWLQPGNNANREVFLNSLRQASDYGLNEKDYQFEYLKPFQSNNYQLLNNDDSLDAEIRFTDAALHFYNDMAYGNTKPALGYAGLKYTPTCQNIPALLAEYISANKLQALVPQLAGSLPEIAALQKKLSRISNIMRGNDFKEVRISSKTINNSNIPLVTKLYQLGVIELTDLNLPDSILKKKVKEAQLQFNQLPDGKLNALFLQELNIPLSARKQRLGLSLNYYRWLNCLSGVQPVITVNIPAAYLKVYHQGKVILEMRMVVGKKTTPTPTLSSTVSEVILYPYWHVPLSIATKELLPIIKKNPGFINKGNYQVLNSAGNITDPYSVDWNALSKTYFPYVIRQSTGCDNALGLLKLNFYNPFSVYLHDTNSKNIFKYNRRYFSHGCMRLQKPMELGHLVLKNNPIAIDTLEQKGCLRNQSPITVPATQKLPVIVWYNPAGIDSTGRVLFYEDVYNKFNP